MFISSSENWLKSKERKARFVERNLYNFDSYNLVFICKTQNVSTSTA